MFYYCAKRSISIIVGMTVALLLGFSPRTCLGQKTTPSGIPVNPGERYCAGCYQSRVAKPCDAMYDLCAQYNSTSNPIYWSLLKRYFAQYIPLMEDDSNLLKKAKRYAHCRQFQKLSTEAETFCQAGVESAAFMTAKFFADVAAEAIRVEYRAESVTTLLVDIQMDERSPEQYIADVMRDIQGNKTSEKFDIIQVPENSASLELLPSTAHQNGEPGPNGYRMWSIHLPNHPTWEGKKIAVKQAVQKAARKFGKGIYLARGAIVTVEPDNYFVVSLKAANPCTACW